MLKKLSKHLGILFFMLLPFGTGVSHAQNAIKIIESGGREIIYDLSTRPKVTFEKHELWLTASDIQVIYPMSPETPLRLEFVDADESEETANVDENSIAAPYYKVNGESVEVFNHSAGAMVYVFDMNGTVVGESRTDSEGYAAVSIQALPQGVYAVKAETTTFKIFKK